MNNFSCILHMRRKIIIFDTSKAVVFQNIFSRLQQADKIQMCINNLCRKSPCGMQVLVGMLWITFLLTVAIVGVAYLFLKNTQLEGSLGHKDEYLIDFPKLLCSSVEIEKFNNTNGVHF